MQAEWPSERVLEYLIEAIRFSRRMGNYLFLPLFVVFAFCSVFVIGFYLTGNPLSSRANFLNVFLMVVAFCLWWLTRKPSIEAFFGMGLILAALDLTFASFFVYRVATEESSLLWIFQVPMAAVWVLALGSAAVQCFYFWRNLRHFHPEDLAEAYRLFQTGTGIAENGSGDSTTQPSH